MAIKQGNLSINSDNIFPIIKKWLYSDHDIFVREMVSNGCDAITKLKKLSLMGEYTAPADEKYEVHVAVSADNLTISFSDNGLGMTADEVEEYINQIAFSGAQDFLAKYKDKANDDQIIGHFGLGFYSAFMVADKVTIDTLSYVPEAIPVHWESEGGVTFEMKDGEKTERGTTITLYLNEDSKEFANEYRIREILDKYCSFMPIPIYLENADKKDETEMPTTQMLLWQNEIISPEYHNEIAAKVKETFGRKLPTRKEEEADHGLSKMRIVEIVSQIRQNCRGDEILRQYNIEFGFCRNYLGASVWSILFLISIGVTNIFYAWLPWWTIVVALVLQMLLMTGSYMLLEVRGWAYAKYLFATFTGN